MLNAKKEDQDVCINMENVFLVCHLLEKLKIRLVISKDAVFTTMMDVASVLLHM